MVHYKNSRVPLKICKIFIIYSLNLNCLKVVKFDKKISVIDWNSNSSINQIVNNDLLLFKISKSWQNN